MQMYNEYQQKEREAFEEYITSKHKNRSPLILTQRIQHGFSENYIVQGVQDCWETWQAAKAQAIPDGFVVVPKEPSEYLANHGHQVFLGHFNEGGQTGGRSLYFAYKAIVEAQESDND